MVHYLLLSSCVQQGLKGIWPPSLAPGWGILILLTIIFCPGVGIFIDNFFQKMSKSPPYARPHPPPPLGLDTDRCINCEYIFKGLFCSFLHFCLSFLRKYETSTPLFLCSKNYQFTLSVKKKLKIYLQFIWKRSYRPFLAYKLLD